MSDFHSDRAAAVRLAREAASLASPPERAAARMELRASHPPLLFSVNDTVTVRDDADTRGYFVTLEEAAAGAPTPLDDRTYRVMRLYDEPDRTTGAVFTSAIIQSLPPSERRQHAVRAHFLQKVGANEPPPRESSAPRELVFEEEPLPAATSLKSDVFAAAPILVALLAVLLASGLAGFAFLLSAIALFTTALATSWFLAKANLISASSFRGLAAFVVFFSAVFVSFGVWTLSSGSLSPFLRVLISAGAALLVAVCIRFLPSPTTG